TNPDTLNVVLQGNDSNGDVIQFGLRLLDARGQAGFTVDRVAFNPPPTSPGNFTANITFTGLRGFLGTCSCEVTVIDRAGNRSNARAFNVQSCSLPIIDGAAASPINGDQVRVDIRAAD